MPHDTGRRLGLLVAVEGLDAANTSATAELLARWLERQGRRVHVVPWEVSNALRRASADPRRRQALTPRVAALLVAAEAVRRIVDRVGGPLDAGETVVADRYAWTPVARGVARDLDPAWVANLYAPVPCPDLVLLARIDPLRALGRSLEPHPAARRADAVGPAFAEFVGALSSAFDGLAAGILPGPWPVRVTTIEAERPAEAVAREARAAVRPLLDRPGRAIA
jgi:thymidylate kinase